MTSTKDLKADLDRATRPGELFERISNEVFVCTACGHLCKLKPGQRGVCKVRYNEGGTLRVPYHYAAGIQNDPIEKKPFFHALPGSRALSFGMLGCDFRCGYCQNWFTSQTLRDDAATLNFKEISAGEICDLAESNGSKTLVSTYNEPLITSEWAVEVFQEAKKRGLKTAYVSNGHGTPQVLKYIRPWVDFYKIDLKCFSESNYRRLGGNLPAVLETIQSVHDMGMWLEIVTLVIPGYNDSDAELTDIAEFIASVAKDIPWHVTAYHPDYKMTDRGRTPIETLLRAREIGKTAGLQFVYSGNLAGQVGDCENTHCPGCGDTLVERRGFQVLANRLQGNACPGCGETIAGRWQ